MKVVDYDYLSVAMMTTTRINKSELARALHISRKTLSSIIKDYGLEADYSDVSNEELSEFVRRFKEERPTQGYRMFEGFLLAEGVKLPIKRIKEALHPVDRATRQLHQKRIRQPYKAEGSNAVWHIDGHHKLIRWGFVIHGAIDGYDRMVSIYLKEQRGRLTSIR